MQRSISLRTDIATTGMAAIATAAVVAAPLAAVPAPAVAPTVVHDIRLAAAVPPGGLITSFLHNQTVYCSIICPLIAQTGVTAVSTALQAPGTFLAALSAGDVLKAIGATAASVTGPTEAAALKAIDADAAIPAQRALNAFEVAVVGLLNVLPAAQNGLPGIAAALQKARQDTFDALNLPFVPNPAPTVQPHGVFQVAVVGAINVVAAVIFPAFNDVLAGVFQVPDAVAQELAKTGNPVRALAAGIKTAAGVVAAAGAVVAQAVATAVHDVRNAAAGQSADTSKTAPTAVAALAPKTVTTSQTSTPRVTTPPRHDGRDAASAPGDTTTAETTASRKTELNNTASQNNTARQNNTGPHNNTAPQSSATHGTSDTTGPDKTGSDKTGSDKTGSGTSKTDTADTGTTPHSNPTGGAASTLRTAAHNLVKNLTPKPPHPRSAPGQGSHGTAAHHG